MKQRNPNATCGNCPYWYALNVEIGECRQDNAKVIDQDDGSLVFPLALEDEWCGQHPEFWLPAEPAEPAESIPTCWPAPENGRIWNSEEVYKFFWSGLGTPDAKLNVQCKTEDSKNDK